jgi:hypothetical protein
MTWTSPRALPLLLALAACNQSSPGDTGDSAATTTAAGTDSDTSTGGPTSAPDPTTGGPTTAPDPTTGAVTTTGPDPATSVAEVTTDATTAPGTSTGADDTSTGTGDTGTSTGDTGTTGDDAEYAAFYIAGGLDRILVRKANADADLCTSMVFVWPGPDQDPPGWDVALPAMWGVQGGSIAQGVADCLVFMAPLPGEFAVGGAGSAAWMTDPNLFCPETLDIDLTLEFAADMPWVPDQDTLQATAVPVQGC